VIGVSDESPIGAKLAAACAAGLTGFALAAGPLLLFAGAFDGWWWLASFLAIPAAVIALMPFRLRIFSFGLGLVAVFGTSFMNTSGADNWTGILPLAAMCLSVGAVIGELCVRAGQRVRRPSVADADA
jgi:hypothetical protein